MIRRSMTSATLLSTIRFLFVLLALSCFGGGTALAEEKLSDEYRNYPFDKNDSRPRELVKKMHENKEARNKNADEGRLYYDTIPTEEQVKGEENLYAQIGAYCGRYKTVTIPIVGEFFPNDYIVEECTYTCQRTSGGAKEIVGRIGKQIELDRITKNDFTDAVLVWYPILDNISDQQLEAEKGVMKDLVQADLVEDKGKTGWRGQTASPELELPLAYYKVVSRERDAWYEWFGSGGMEAYFFEAAIYSDMTSDYGVGLQATFKKKTTPAFLARGLAEIEGLDADKEIGITSKGVGISGLTERRKLYAWYDNESFIRDLDIEQERWIRGFAKTCNIARGEGR